jgi:GntR family transcriptional regulator
MENGPVVEISTLGITPVDPNSPIPLYFQIENDLRRLISSGKLGPNATIPPELELGRAYGVGRHTMRSALARLAADGLITRRAGRGTIVKPPTDRMKFYLDRSFTRQMAEMGRTPFSDVLEKAVTRIDKECPEVFRNKIGKSCLKLVRLRMGDHEPIGVQSSIVLTELCPGLERYDFNQNSLYDILATEYQLVIARIQHTIGAAVADEFQGRLLHVQEGDPLLVVKTAAFLDNGQVVEHTISHYRADRYEYSTTHTYSA